MRKLLTILILAVLLASIVGAQVAISSVKLSADQQSKMEDFIKAETHAKSVQYVNYIQKSGYYESTVKIEGVQFRMFQDEKSFNASRGVKNG